MEQVSWLRPIGTKVFATTRWSAVRACSQASEAQSKEALAEICQAYWQPVYVCIRHHGHSPHDAQDLAQDFFVQLLDGRYFEHLDQQKGRFRAYLSTALRNFLRDRWRRRWTWRKGRGTVLISLDTNDEQFGLALLFGTGLTPESVYERQWARVLIEHVLQQLKLEMIADDKEILFEHFEAVLAGGTLEFPYVQVARDLSLTVAALHATLHRWRRRFQALMRAEIGRTVLSKTEIEDELRHLLGLFSENS